MENIKVEARNGSGGIGLTGVVFVVFLVLKLTHVIAWSWWWVFAPLWIPAAIVLVMLLVLCVAYLIGDRWNDR